MDRPISIKYGIIIQEARYLLHNKKQTNKRII